MQLCTKLQQRSTLVFLQTYLTPHKAQTASLEQLTHVLKQAGHTTAEQVAPKIYRLLHQPHLTADAVTTRTRISLDGGSGRTVAAEAFADRGL